MNVSTWQLWTELLIPLAGVIASTVIAVVAVVVTIRLARADRRELELSKRASFAGAASDFLQDIGRADASDEEHFQRARDQLRSAAATATPDSHAIYAWLVSNGRRARENSDLGAFERVSALRLAQWVSGGRFEY